VAACAEAGTDYVDLTGESEFVDRMYVAHHATAEQPAPRIVHACGFDSIPHDLGAYFTVQQLAATGRSPCAAWCGPARSSRRHLPLRPDGLSRRRQTPRGLRRPPRDRAAPRGRRSRAVGASRTATACSARGCCRCPPSTRRRGAQRRRAPVVRTRLPLLPLRRHEDAAVRRRRAPRRWPCSGSPHRCRRAAARCSAASRRARARRGPPCQVVVHRRLRGRRRRPDRAHPGQRRRPGYDETAKMLAESALCLAFDDNPPTAGRSRPRRRWATRSPTGCGPPA
jgi:hypothetical protein